VTQARRAGGRGEKKKKKAAEMGTAERKNDGKKVRRVALAVAAPGDGTLRLYR
jgi:hypothetical protein